METETRYAVTVYNAYGMFYQLSQFQTITVQEPEAENCIIFRLQHLLFVSILYLPCLMLVDMGRD